MHTRSNAPSLLALCALLAASSACKHSGKDKATSTDVVDTVVVPGDDTHVKSEEPKGEMLESSEYRFRLTSPGPGWQLQDRQQIQQITPDAQVGLAHTKGVMAVVIVERAAGMTVQAMTDLIINGMPLENKQIVAREDDEYLGLPAVRYQLTGNISDIPMSYSGRVFLREGYAYQIVAFAAKGVAEQSLIDEVFDNFSLTEGKIEPKSEHQQRVDTDGVGWRLKGGVFESAVSGLRVTPTEGWRAVVGAEARRINADAEVVMVNNSPEAYFFVLPELIGSASPEVYRADRLAQNITAMKGEIKQETYPGKILGEEVQMTQLSSSDFPWVFQVGVGFHDGWAVQATGWYSSSFGEEGKKAIHTAIGNVTRMSAADVAKLREELLAQPDQQNQVGANHSLRGGVYEDYEHGVRWTKPLGFWEVYAGHAARDVNPIAQLYARYQNSSAHMLLVAEDLPPGTSAAEYHSAAFSGVSKNLNLKAKKRAVRATIGSGAALLSDGMTEAAGIELYYRVITAVQGSHGLQLHLWGPAAGISQHEKALSEVAKKLELLDTLTPTSHKGDRFIEHRLGYSLDLPSQYRYVDATPAEIAGIGSFATWGVDGKDWVGILALCMIEEGQDEEWSLDFMEGRIKESYAQLLGDKSAARSEEDLFGLRARHLVWTSPGVHLDAYLFRRGKTIFALMATDADQGTDMIGLAKRGFSFLN